MRIVVFLRHSWGLHHAESRQSEARRHACRNTGIKVTAAVLHDAKRPGSIMASATGDTRVISTDLRPFIVHSFVSNVCNAYAMHPGRGLGADLSLLAGWS
jgi:hypothetical protein